MSNETIPLGDLVEIEGGGTPSRNTPEFWNGGIPWATVKDLTDAELSSTQEFISKEGVASSATRIIPAGSVIMATRMGLGKVAINKIDVAINQDLKALRCNGKVDPKFLLYFLQSKADYLESQGKGATVKGIKLDLVRSLAVPRISLPEQRRIATILDKADAIRRKRRQAIDLMNDFLRSVFLEMFGDPVKNTKQWESIELEKLAEVVSGVTKGRKLVPSQLVSVPYMRVANVQDGRLDLSEVKEIEVLEGDVSKYSLRSGDLLLTEGGDPDKLGRGSVWYGEIKKCIHQNHIFRVRVLKNSQLAPEYLSALIGSEYGKRYFLRAAKQTTGIATINSRQLKAFPVLRPPIDLQSRFVSIVLKQREMLSKLMVGDEKTESLFHSISAFLFAANSRVANEAI